MFCRQGLWQRILGACLAVVLVSASEAFIPNSATAQSQKTTHKRAVVSIKSQYHVRYQKVTRCSWIWGHKKCVTYKAPVLVPLNPATTTTTTVPIGTIPPFVPTTTVPGGHLVGGVTASTMPHATIGTEPTTTTTTTPTTTTTTTPPTTTTSPPSVPSPNPGPTNPGVLTTMGPLTITQDGAVIQNVNVQGTITVAANNVTIRNFRANNVYKNPGKAGLLMEYGELHGEQNTWADGVVWSDYTARYLNVHDLFDGFKAHGNVLIENSWVHDLKFRTGPEAGAGGYTHNDGVQVSSGSNVTIRNSIFERNLGNAAIFIDADQGAISNVLVEGNRLGGGGFTLYSIQSRSAPQFGRPTNVIIRNNVFTEEHHYDYATIAPTGTTWTNNKNINGQLISSRIDNF